MTLTFYKKTLAIVAYWGKNIFTKIDGNEYDRKRYPNNSDFMYVYQPTVTCYFVLLLLLFLYNRLTVRIVLYHYHGYLYITG